MRAYFLDKMLELVPLFLEVFPEAVAGGGGGEEADGIFGGILVGKLDGFFHAGGLEDV